MSKSDKCNCEYCSRRLEESQAECKPKVEVKPSAYPEGCCAKCGEPLEERGKQKWEVVGEKPRRVCPGGCPAERAAKRGPLLNVPPWNN